MARDEMSGDQPESVGSIVRALDFMAINQIVVRIFHHKNSFSRDISAVRMI